MASAGKKDLAVMAHPIAKSLNGEAILASASLGTSLPE